MIERIYLGDRAVKGFEIESQSEVIRIQIDCISRLRIDTDKWDFYDEEDIENGYIVFNKVYYFEVVPSSIIPGDYIIDYKFTKIENGWEFIISTVGQPNEIYNGDKESTVRIRYHDCWLEDEFKKVIL